MRGISSTRVPDAAIVDGPQHGEIPAAIGVMARAMRRAAVLALPAAAMLMLLLELVGAGRSPAVPAPGPRPEAIMAQAPPAIQQLLNARLGMEAAGYHASSGAGRLTATNPDLHMSLAFTASGVSVTRGSTTLGLHATALGYGSALSSLPGAAPRARENRVSYARPGVTEWYVNGPLGLEQGFTVTAPPAAHAAGPLTIAVSLAGARGARLIEGGRTLALGGGLRYSGLSASDANGRALPSSLALRGDSVLLRVNVRGARFRCRSIGSLRSGTKLPSGGPGDVDLARRQHDRARRACATCSSGSSWVEQAVLNTSAIEGSGYAALSADGNTALLGNEGFEKGRGGAVVYARSGETWTQQSGVLQGAEQAGLPRTGDGVALSADGNTAAIGSRLDNGTHGAVYVFTRSGSTWTQQGPRLTASDEEGDSVLGASVALSADGNTLIAGGWRDNSFAGAAWVFTRAGETWTQQGPKLVVAGLEGGSEMNATGFGKSVALSEDGDTALIGAPGVGSGRGAAWAFTRSGETWTQQGELLGEEEGTRPESPGEFGASVALSGNGGTALVAGPGNSGARAPCGSSSAAARRGRPHRPASSARSARRRPRRLASPEMRRPR